MKKLSKADAKFLGEMEPDKLTGPKFTSHIILLTLFLFIVIAIIWAHFAILDEVTRGIGKVIPSRQIQEIQNLEGGIVKEILVHEGEMVNKGQALMILDDTRFTASYNENLTKINSLEIKLLRLKAEILNHPFTIPKALEQKQPEAVHFEKALYEARKQEIDELKESYRLAQEEIAITKPLVIKGAASPVEVLRLQRSASEINSKVINFRSETLKQLNDVKAELSALKESNVANLDRLSRTTVRAPVKGIIKQLHIHTVGGVVQPGSKMIEIVPLDDTLLVEAEIKPKDIGFIHPNQPATVNISAYDYTIYGSLKGDVENISADAITEEKTEDTYYLIKVRTQKNYLGSQEKPLYIIPGMQATVEIKTGKKSVLDYILNPLINIGQKALRER